MTIKLIHYLNNTQVQSFETNLYEAKFLTNSALFVQLTIIMKLFAGILIQLVLLSLSEGHTVNPGPEFIATKGEVWPKPNNQVKYETYFDVKPELFQFKVDDKNGCTVLREALLRYSKIINDHYGIVVKNLGKMDQELVKKPWFTDDNYLGSLPSLDISFSESCSDTDYPQLDMDEKYQLNITETNALLTASTVWGVLRGLETFSQLLYIGNEELSLRINSTSISDYPRFPHRGLLMDTSRHFIPVSKILTTLDALAYNKFNVFHWHIVDDESFPYVSVKYPELSDKGAFKPSQIYSVDEVREIIEYARLRGIRVIPEFSTPGHSRSWGISHPELLTTCTDLKDKYGPIDPSNNYVYEFLQGLFTEISQIFPEQYVHLGDGDVNYDCWESNSNISEFMKEKKIKNSDELQNYYITNVVNTVKNIGLKSIVWEENYSNAAQLPSDVIVQSWLVPWDVSLLSITSSGRRALLSGCWDLDGFESDWNRLYRYEPYDFSTNTNLRKLVLGGEVCMWSEVVNKYNVISKVWPRASAVAEKLWGDYNITTVEEATLRLEEHVCRMVRRGIDAPPSSGPGFCP